MYLDKTLLKQGMGCLALKYIFLEFLFNLFCVLKEFLFQRLREKGRTKSFEKPVISLPK